MAYEKRVKNSDVTTEYERSDNLRDSEMMTHIDWPWRPFLL